MGWPQYTWIALAALGVGIALAMHGRPREGNHNVLIALVRIGVTFAMLWFGGFFGGPQ